MYNSYHICRLVSSSLLLLSLETTHKHITLYTYEGFNTRHYTLQYTVSCFFKLFPTGCIGLILSCIKCEGRSSDMQHFRDGMVFCGLLLPCLLALYCNKHTQSSVGPYTVNSYKSLTKVCQPVLSHIASWVTKIALHRWCQHN